MPVQLKWELQEKAKVAQETTTALSARSIDDLRDRMTIVHYYWCLCMIVFTVQMIKF